MADTHTGSSTVGRRYTRRQLLRSGIVAVGGLALAGGGVASGQNDNITTEAVIPEQTEYAQDLVGFWLHLQGEVSANPDAAIADSCDVFGWDGDETVGYEATLIDRSADPQSSTVTLYLKEGVEISSGDLFIINSREQCQSGYVGLQIERVSSITGVGGDSTATEGGGAVTDETTVSGNGPGFGAISTLAGALGVGWLLNRRRSD